MGLLVQQLMCHLVEWLGIVVMKVLILFPAKKQKKYFVQTKDAGQILQNVEVFYYFVLNMFYA